MKKSIVKHLNGFIGRLKVCLQQFVRDDLTFRYCTNTSADMGATALASGFQSLFESAKLLNIHLKLEFNDKLDNIITEYREFHSHNLGPKSKR